MSDDPLDGIISREELERFEARHPNFREALTHLQARLEVALLRTLAPRPDKLKEVQSVVFGLAHQAADDFFDVLLLAVHGYGFGAVKLLRPLFERVVTALYLIKNPDQVQAFDKYADIDAWHLLSWAQMSGIDPAAFMTADELADARTAYQRVKPDFTSPKKKRERGTWSRKDLAARAENVGLKQLYGPASLWPSLHLHTTRIGFEAYLSRSGDDVGFTHRSRPEQTDHALRYAHGLIVLLLKECNSFFGWGLDLKDVINDVERCWSRAAGAP